MSIISIVFVIILINVTSAYLQLPDKKIPLQKLESTETSTTYYESQNTPTLEPTVTGLVDVVQEFFEDFTNATHVPLAMAHKTEESAAPTDEPTELITYYYESMVTATSEPSVETSFEPSETEPLTSFEPSLVTTIEPSLVTTLIVTYEPSASVTSEPSVESTSGSSTKPSFGTLEPSFEPTYTTQESTIEPSFEPSVKYDNPTLGPTSEPTTNPAISLRPSLLPITKNTFKPTLSVKPSAEPSVKPSKMPSLFPSCKPVSSPTYRPSKTPSYRPTTSVPATSEPSISFQPSVDSKAPSRTPTSVPAKKTRTPNTFLPTVKSTFLPTSNETDFPTVSPTADSSNLTIGTNPYDVPGLSQNDEAAYLATWSAMIKDSFTEPLPLNFDSTCVAAINPYTSASNMHSVTLDGNFNASTFQKQCGTSNLCILSAGSTLTMDGNLNVAALLIHGTLTWTDSTQTSPQQWLCAGYVVVEEQGSFIMNIASPNLKSLIYLKDNGATHPSSLQTRVFGGHSRSGTSFPTIDVSGRPLARTWSLLAVPAATGVSSITLLHDPISMGWQVGDRIVIAAMARRSQGTAQWFSIIGMSSTTNQITLSSPTNQNFDAQITSATGSNVALMSAEVINLSR